MESSMSGECPKCNEHALECTCGSLRANERNDRQATTDHPEPLRGDAQNGRQDNEKWISVKDRLPLGAGDIVMAKRENGNITKVYYHKDCMGWLHSHYKFPWTHWQDKETLAWLTDITHWMPLPKAPK